MNKIYENNQINWINLKYKLKYKNKKIRKIRK